MKITATSDLHLEFYTRNSEFMNIFKNREKSDVLVLAGDVAEYSSMQFCLKFFDYIHEEYENVVLIKGNHEIYRSNFNNIDDDLSEFYSQWSNFKYLEEETVDIDGVTFIGTTLWTDQDKGNPILLQLSKGWLNDYNMIKKSTRILTPEDTYNAHKYSRDFIFKEEKKHENTVVVVTHHAPSIQSVNDLYAEDNLNGMINFNYYSSLEEPILDSNIALWIHGHLHNTSDYMIGDTRVFANCFGYPQENDFKLIQIEV